MRLIVVFIAIFALTAIACAVPIRLTAPFEQAIDNGDSVFIGTIGPGQTLDVRINPIVTTGGIYGTGGQYDIANISSLPRGWKFEPSKLYGNPLQVKITADASAPEGKYYADITVVDENNGEQLGNVTFRVMINITQDVLDMDVSPKQVTVVPGQPAEFSITITNKGSASDTYTVNTSGVKQWDFVKQIYVPAKSSRTIPYAIIGNEEEIYQLSINVVSVSSNIIREDANATLNIKSGLIEDYKATSHGTLIFPIFEAPIYALAGLLGALAGAFGL